MFFFKKTKTVFFNISVFMNFRALSIFSEVNLLMLMLMFMLMLIPI